MISVCIPNWFGVWIEDGCVRMEFDGSGTATIKAPNISHLLAGHVVAAGMGTICLTGTRLVITLQADCSVLLFPVALRDEFVSQLDALDNSVGLQ